MTDMRRLTISLPNALDEKILSLRKTDRFVRSSYSEIVRVIIEAGVDGLLRSELEPTPPAGGGDSGQRVRGRGA